MFGKSTQDSAAPSFFYLMMAAAYFRQATHTRHRHLPRRATGREHLTNAHRVVPPHGSPGRWPAILSHLTLKSPRLSQFYTALLQFDSTKTGEYRCARSAS